jgi:carbonic anhydrase
MKLTLLFRSVAISASIILSLGAFANDSHTGPTGLPPEQALQLLKEGNQRFVEGHTDHPHQYVGRRSELAAGQNPHTIVLSCADSRVPPEVIFDQGLGDVFTIRVAGNFVGAAEMASIEYAVAHLGTRLIVVMGHESCGAVKAALSTPKEKSAGSADLDQLVHVIQGNLGDVTADVSKDKTLRTPVMKNVDSVTDRLVTRSKIVRDAVVRGQVKIVRAIYGLASGKVDIWGTK